MIVTLLTDFGTSDHYVGVMKGVVLGADERIRLVDLTHEVPPGRMETGAFALLASYRHFPAGTVHVAVVDPGVGSARRALVVEAGGQRFVGPDNGLFSYLLDVEPEARVREVTSDRFFRNPLSTTFHGRDLFAPVGAALATGIRPDEVGPVVANPVRLPPIHPTVGPGGTLLGRILHVDHFGNCVTSFSGDDLARATDGIRLAVQDREIGRLRRHYSGAEAGEPFLVWGSSGYLEVAVNGGSAAALLHLETGAPVEVRAGPERVAGARAGRPGEER